MRLRGFKFIGGFATILILTACASPSLDPSKPHHRSGGFVNSDGTSGDGDKNFFSTMWKFASGEFTAKPPTIGYEAFEANSLAAPNLLPADALSGAAALTWLGHAGVLLQISGLNLIFDPIFNDRASPVTFAGPKRKVKLALSIDDLPAIDAIFISHSHYDHLDEKTIVSLLKKSKDSEKLCAYVPLRMGRWFRARGYTCVHELDWWDRLQINDQVSVTATPSHHWSRRGFFDKNEILWAGFLIDVIGARPFRFIHLGDTGYSQDFTEIGRRFGPIDLAAIPIGAYEPRDFMGTAHVSPKEAVQIMKDLQAKSALGIHWGTFELTRESLDQPPKDLAIALTAASISPENFFVLKHGETIKLATEVQEK